MPFYPVPNVVKAEISGSAGPYAWAHVLHYQYTGGPPSQANLAAGATVLVNQYNTHFGAYMHQTVAIQKGVLTDLNSATGALGEALVDIPGPNATEALPYNCAFLISKAINRRYRGGHPRAYLLVGLATHLQDPHSWAPSIVTSLTNAYAAFISGTANGGLWASVGPEVTVHRTLDKVTLQQPFVDTVQSYTGSPGVASQRRRIGR